MIELLANVSLEGLRLEVTDEASVATKVEVTDVFLEINSLELAKLEIADGASELTRLDVADGTAELTELDVANGASELTELDVADAASELTELDVADGTAELTELEVMDKIVEESGRVSEIVELAGLEVLDSREETSDVLELKTSFEASEVVPTEVTADPEELTFGEDETSVSVVNVEDVTAVVSEDEAVVSRTEDFPNGSEEEAPPFDELVCGEDV